MRRRATSPGPRRAAITAAVVCLLASGCLSTVTVDPNAPIASRLVRGAGRELVQPVILEFLTASRYEILEQDRRRGLIVARYRFSGASTTCSTAARLKDLVDTGVLPELGTNPLVTVHLRVSDTPAGAKIMAQAKFQATAPDGSGQVSLMSTSRWERELINSVFPPTRQPSIGPLIRVRARPRDIGGSYEGELMSHSAGSAPVKRCVTAFISPFRNGIVGSLRTTDYVPSRGSVVGKMSGEEMIGLEIVFGGSCASELRGTARFDASGSLLRGAAAGHDCDGPLDVSFTLERE